MIQNKHIKLNVYLSNLLNSLFVVDLPFFVERDIKMDVYTETVYKVILTLANLTNKRHKKYD